ncbi:TPA: hypothetical protein ACH3X2_004097 [Trebouxia sp. C0005]
MAKRSLDLCCSESSDDISAMCTPWHDLTPSSNIQQPVSPELAPRPVVSDSESIREDLEMLLLRERQGPRLWNYLPQHNFLTHAHRIVLVAYLSSAGHSQGYELTTTALAVSILDRFAAKQYLQTQECGFMWLAALACLSLAAKLEEVGMPSTISALQDEEPWRGHYDPKNVSDMEMLIMRALGWRPRALTPASFLDQVLWDTLAGPLYQLHLQPGDYLSHARHLAANIVSSNMTAVMSLFYPASTQACAAIVVAFRALHVSEDLLRSLVSEWTQLGIFEVWACVCTIVRNIDILHQCHTGHSGVSDSVQPSLSPFQGFVSDSEITSYCSQDNNITDQCDGPAFLPNTNQSVLRGPPPTSPSSLETASSLLSANTMI